MFRCRSNPRDAPVTRIITYTVTSSHRPSHHGSHDCLRSSLDILLGMFHNSLTSRRVSGAHGRDDDLDYQSIIKLVLACTVTRFDLHIHGRPEQGHDESYESGVDGRNDHGGQCLLVVITLPGIVPEQGQDGCTIQSGTLECSDQGLHPSFAGSEDSFTLHTQSP